jgi:beta-galactosidase GanA
VSGDGLWFGGDYSPEQWDAATWAEDDELMRRARVNTATVGVFSWALLEPEEGKFEFGWLDDTLDRLHAGGVRVILATPTASPPPWFTLAYPDAMPVRPDGTRLWHRNTVPPDPGAGALPGVSVTRRRDEHGRSWLCAVNHSTAPATLLAAGLDLITGREVDGSLDLAPDGIAVIRERTA